MKISRLELVAFGPFTDQSLVLQGEYPGLHVVYGANEAGKSSALRALKAWLFGFPERTTDTFIHPYPKLLVGGELDDPRHGRLLFYRRKKRLQSIVDEQGEPMDPERLRPFLDRLDRTLFETLYGIDHEALVRGGEDLLANRGELGEAIFAAGTGITAVHALLESLTGEADQLYRPRASNPPLNRVLTRHRELKREIRELSLPASHWNRLQQELQTIDRELADREQERKELDQQRRRLERLQQARPLSVRLATLRRQREELGRVTRLPPDFSDRRQKVQEELRTASRRIREITHRLQAIAQKVASLAVDSAVLDRAGEIEGLHQRLGEYNKAMLDRPRIQGLRSAHRREAARLLQQLLPERTLGDFALLQPVLQRKRTITTMVQQRTALQQERKSVDREISTVRQRLQTIAGRMGKFSRTPPPLQDLVQAIQSCRRLGEIDLLINRLQEEQADTERTIRLELARNTLWQGTPEALGTLPLPAAETVGRYRDRFGELGHEQQRLSRQIQEAEEELIRLDAEYDRLEMNGEIPTEEELRRVRRERDSRWQQIRSAWLDGQDRDSGPEEKTALADRFAGLVIQADHLGDRLRREADRVHRFASLRAGKREWRGRLQQLGEQRADLEKRRSRLQADWLALWTPLGITPLDPADMTGWLTTFAGLQQEAERMARQAEKLRLLKEKRHHHRRILAKAIQDLGRPVSGEAELEPLLEAGEDLLARLESEEEERRTLLREQAEQQGRLDELLAARDRITAALAAWEEEWGKTTGIGLDGFQLLPDEAAETLDTLSRIRTKLEQADECSSRMEGIDRDSRAFADLVRETMQRLAPDLADQDISVCVEHLQRQLIKARKRQTLLESHREEEQALLQELDRVRQAEKTCRQEMEQLLARAQCDREDELAAAEERSREDIRLERQIREVEEDLLLLAGDQDLEGFLAMAAEIDMDELPGRLHELHVRIEEELDPQIRSLAERKGELRNELESMDGRDRAAARAAELETNLAAMRRLVRRYARLQLAAGLLRREMDRFRESSQDPVLCLGGELFSALTRNRFTGLTPDVDDRGAPVLVARRADGTRLPVEAMSTGTRDQLYLALRLAALQRRAARGQSLPFIVDDILINFDDERTTATLEVLARLGRTNQVILFTHHRHVVRAAASLDGPVQIHEL